MALDIKTFLKEEIKKMKPKTVFKLTDIYSGDNPKNAGKKLSELVNESEVEETIYLGKDTTNIKWYVKGFKNQ